MAVRSALSRPVERKHWNRALGVQLLVACGRLALYSMATLATTSVLSVQIACLAVISAVFVGPVTSSELSCLQMLIHHMNLPSYHFGGERPAWDLDRDVIENILKHDVPTSHLVQDTSSATISGTGDDTRATDDEVKTSTKVDDITAVNSALEETASEKSKMANPVPGPASAERKCSRFDGRLLSFH